MVGVVVEHEVPAFEFEGGHFYREADGTVTGLTFLKHVSREENVGVVLQQAEPATAEWHFVEVFTVDPSDDSSIPDADLDSIGTVAEDTLNKDALAFSVAYTGKESGVYAGYAWTPGHAQEKAEMVIPEGSKRKGPIPISQHNTTMKAILFAFCLNKYNGKLSNGASYERLPELLAVKGRAK